MKGSLSKKEYDKKRYIEKREEYLLRAKIHKQKNKQTRWPKEKKILADNFDKRCYKNILTLIKNYFRKGIEQTKYSKTFLRLGYTLPELKERLLQTIPEGFDWEDYIKAELHLDHIIPHSRFKYDSYEHENFKAAWDLKNLRLLPKSINIKRQDNENI